MTLLSTKTYKPVKIELIFQQYISEQFQVPEVKIPFKIPKDFKGRKTFVAANQECGNSWTHKHTILNMIHAKHCKNEKLKWGVFSSIS